MHKVNGGNWKNQVDVSVNMFSLLHSTRVKEIYITYLLEI